MTCSTCLEIHLNSVHIHEIESVCVCVRERERERQRGGGGKVRNYSKESSFLMAKVKEFNDIGPCMGAPDLALVLEDGSPGDGQFSQGFEFRGPEVSSKQSIQFPTHLCSLCLCCCSIQQKTSWSKNLNMVSSVRNTLKA